MTVTFDESVYNGLLRVIGRGHISQFLEDLARPHVLGDALDDGYKAMAADREREAEAHEWVEALHGDMRHETR
jgi:hypothetical protein